MFAARQRAGYLARQLQRPARSYASDAHGHHAPDAPVNESFGKGSMSAVAVFFGGVLFFQFKPKEGEESAIRNWIGKYTSRPEDWEEINALHTKAMEQAGFDRNLFENASNKHRFVNVSYPEHLDDVVEHFRQQHIKDEERKAKKLAEQQR